MPDTMLEGFHLAPQQTRLWTLFEGSLGPGVARVMVELHGPLDRTALQAALNALCMRYEITQTVFRMLPGMSQPLQMVADTPDVPLIQIPDQAPEQAFAALEAGLNLEQAPTMQAAVCQINTTLSRVYLVLPALCADTPTLSILVQELATAYQAAQGHAVEAPEPLQYADVAEWLNDILDSEDMAAGREYWHQRDFAALRTVQLPFETVSPATLPLKLQQHQLNPAPDLLKAIQAHSAEAADPDLVLLAVWLVILARFTGAAQITVGIKLDGRNYEELEAAVGLFAKVVPLTVDIDQQQSLREFITYVKLIVEEAATWQECFSWEGLLPAGEHMPGLPYGFAYDVLPAALHTSGLEWHIISADSCHERLGVLAHWYKQGDQLKGLLQFDAERHQAGFIEQLAQTYTTFLTAAIKQADRPMAQLALCDQQQQATVLASATGPQLADPVPLFLERFHAQLAAQPAAVAVADATTSLSYAALAAHAMALATTLRQHGVGPDTPVPLLADRSATTIAALLAIMLAGGAYVPIDPATPAARIAHIIEALQPPLVLIDPDLALLLPTTTPTLPLPPLTTESGLSAREFTLPPLQPHNLAYLIYTSGSSGTPKGVAVSHANLAHYLHAIDQRVPSGPGTRAALAVSLAADLGHTILFPTLANGGTLVVFDAATATDADAFATRMQQDAIDLLKLVPTHLSALLSSTTPAAVLPRQTLVLGGERVPWDLWQLLRSFAPELLLRNHYGPTETTVGVLTTVEEPQPGFSASVPLGLPLGHTRIYVLDSQQQLVPAGVRGNIYVGGALVSRGYVGQPAATAAAFLPDPWSPAPGARMYATGDQGRYGLDGTVEFLGRGDTQVKVRGYRVELGEIAAVLRSHEQIRDAAVIADTSTGDTRLTAYLVATGDSVPSRRELRRFLQAHVPDHMVPTTLMPIEALPLLPNGKLDRQALAGLTQRKLKPEKVYIAPRNVVEEVLVGIWSEILGVERISVHDNFFELGGHSLLATRVISHLNSTFQVKLPIRVIFEAPTIAELALMLKAQETEPGQIETIATLVQQIESMPAEEVEAMLNQQQESIDAS